MNVSRGLVLILAMLTASVALCAETGLDIPVDAHIDNQPLVDVLSDWSKHSQVRISIDPAVFASQEIEPETRVNLHLSGPIRLASALKIVLEQLRLNFISVPDGSLLVVNQRGYLTEQRTYVYSSDDLLVEPARTPQHRSATGKLLKDEKPTDEQRAGELTSFVELVVSGTNARAPRYLDEPVTLQTDLRQHRITLTAMAEVHHRVGQWSQSVKAFGTQPIAVRVTTFQATTRDFEQLRALNHEHLDEHASKEAARTRHFSLPNAGPLRGMRLQSLTKFEATVLNGQALRIDSPPRDVVGYDLVPDVRLVPLVMPNSQIAIVVEERGNAVESPAGRVLRPTRLLGDTVIVDLTTAQRTTDQTRTFAYISSKRKGDHD